MARPRCLLSTASAVPSSQSGPVSSLRLRIRRVRTTGLHSIFGSGWCKQKEVVFIYGATVSPTFTFWCVCVFPVALQIVVHLTEDLLSRASMTVVNGCPTLTINVSTAREHWLEGMLRHEIGGAALSTAGS